MKEYIIKNTGNNPVIWDEIDELVIETFPWYEKGVKQLTFVKLVIHNERLFLKVMSIDHHSSAIVTTQNSGVYMDSCFEFFLTPISTLGVHYINFEINCIGTLYMAYNKDIGTNQLATAKQMEQVIIKTSLLKGRFKEPTRLSSTPMFW